MGVSDLLFDRKPEEEESNTLCDSDAKKSQVFFTFCYQPNTSGAG